MSVDNIVKRHGLENGLYRVQNRHFTSSLHEVIALSLRTDECR